MKMQTGRSMVEMLGVLAIIGVLSAGGLAGYSKAMYQHKLNVHKTSFDTLLLNAFTLSEKVEDAFLNGDAILYQLNQIPQKMTYQNGSIYDIFKNRIHVYYNSSLTIAGYRAGIYVTFQNNNENIRACANMVQSAQEVSSEIWLLERSKGTNENGSNTSYEGHLYGDKYCYINNHKCLKDLTMNDILKLCQNNAPDGDLDYYTFYILWNPIIH